MAKKLEPMPELDPFDGYTVYAANREYKGESNGVSFSEDRSRGVSWGRIEPLESGADEDDVAERVELLRWFLNGEGQRFVTGYEDEARKRNPIYEIRKPYRLVADKEAAAEKAEKTAAAAKTKEKTAAGTAA